MMRWLSAYSIRLPQVLAYMLQATEYEAHDYLKWLWRTRDFGKVMNRRNLDKTRIAKLVVTFLVAGMLLQLFIGLSTLGVGAIDGEWMVVVAGVVVVLLTPILWAHLVLLPVAVAKMILIEPQRRKQQAITHDILSKHPATTIAVAGSYGKTTMKEILRTVLAEGKKVAATTANNNVAIAHYQFAKTLEGDEDVLIIEYGESKPGDVKRFTEATRPSIGVITGLAPAHLEGYGSLQAAGEDIFSLAEYLGHENIYVNAESPRMESFVKPSHTTYSRHGVGDVGVEDIQVDFTGTSFVLNLPDQKLELHSQILGAHLVGVLATAAMIGLELGLSARQVQAGIAATKPYEHRMQPYRLGGAWVIDDAYNGNIEGVRAGTELLAALSARRKIYITPGLVEQGEETKAVHQEQGRLIAAAKTDIVVLMNNSVTEFIEAGLEEAGFGGKLQIETDPLRFYSHLDHFVASGDVVILQNDWTDNYY